MKPPLLLLHGALSNHSQFDRLRQSLQGQFELYSPDFPGHDKNSRYGGSIDINTLTDFTLDYIAQQRLQCPPVFGYSMGGYVGLNLAKNHGDTVGRIVTLATHFFWTADYAAKNSAFLNPQKMQQKTPAFADKLRHTFGDDYWTVVLEKTAAMMLQLGQQDLLSENALQAIDNPVMVAVGELDKLVNPEYSRKAATLLPHGRFALLKDSKHLFEQVDITHFTAQLEDFLS